MDTEVAIGRERRGAWFLINHVSRVFDNNAWVWYDIQRSLGSRSMFAVELRRGC